jgi:hypothetical protein
LGVDHSTPHNEKEFDMKRILWVVMTIVLATSAVALAGDEAKKEKAAPVTLTGEVVDLYCYMEHPESATGAEHAKCAKSCISKGLPIGFVTADGTVYLITGKDHESASTLVADWVGKKSTVTGHVREAKGMKSIELVSVGEVKS